MTEGQRDYLADLAGRKGIRLENTDNKSVAWTSEKIEELKQLPDTKFDESTQELDLDINKRIESVKNEVSKWTFQE